MRFPEDEITGISPGTLSDALRATSSTSLAWRADASSTVGGERVTIVGILFC
jgi:hypothetical protein